MPRQPKQDKKQITVIVNGAPISVQLYPPAGRRTSWYAYWHGLVSSKSTGKRKYDDAVVVAENMLKNRGRRPSLQDTLLSDADFVAIQQAHFECKTDPTAKQRAEKTLEDCLDAINAFKSISGLEHIASATPGDCSKFQRQALTYRKNWRQAGFNMDGGSEQAANAELLSPNTVLKWSRQLQAAFERANRNAPKHKCVRGVVDEEKLLSSNPWHPFSWIQGRARPIRQFDAQELLSLLTFLETRWSKVPLAALAAKVFLWSCCRKLEIAGLKWDDLRICENEYHFEVVGKWNVERWFRIPPTLYQELLEFRIESPFVFAAYSDQLRQCHGHNPNWLRNIKEEFKPKNFGRWFYLRVKEWAKMNPRGDAFVHVFRKTALQLALTGEEDASQIVADDARVSKSVFTNHYAKQNLQKKSQRIYKRLVVGLPAEVARRYGHIETEVSAVEKLEAARISNNWPLVAELAAKLARREHVVAG